VSEPSTRQRSGWSAWLAFIVGVTAVWASVQAWLKGSLGLGTLDTPTYGYLVFGLLLLTFGGMAAVGFGLGLWRSRPKGFWTNWRAPRPEPRQAILLVALGAALLPLLVREVLLQGAPLTDDEAAYTFAARLLGSFRLSMPSPTPRLFFDNAFLVNDGKLFTQYFLGWPALLALGELMHAPQLVNAALNAALALGVFSFARRWWGFRWALLAAALAVLSPFLMVGAATLLSHTSCAAAIAWVLALSVKATRPDARWWHSALLAFSFCLAFFIRPQVALAFSPALVWWLIELSPRVRWRHLAAFVAVATPCAALFLAANRELTGSSFTPPYQAYLQYVVQNDSRFSPWKAAAGAQGITNMAFAQPSKMIALSAAALLRLNVDLMGWPASLLLALFSRGGPTRRLAVSTFAFLLLHLPVTDGGIDSFGPVHYFELAVPLVLLSVGGLRRLTAWGRKLGARGATVVVLPALFAVTLTCFLPIRWRELHRLTTDIRRPLDFVEEHAPPRSVIFVVRPIASTCASKPSRHFVYFRPNNRPDPSEDEVLWVNHVSLKRDLEFLAKQGDRPGFLLVHNDQCVQALWPLDKVPADSNLQSVPERPGDFPD
jgi:hypothetical protein